MDATPDRIRNLGLFGHSGCGKTSLGEAVLFLTRENTRLGRTDEGTALLDYDEEETARKISINLALGYGRHGDSVFNIVDTPGYADFVGEVFSGVRAVDAGVIVTDATSGVEFGTELAWGYLADGNLPRVFFVTKLAKENADFAKVLAELRERFGSRVFAALMPIGREAALTGVVDVLSGAAYTYQGGSAAAAPLPAELAPSVAAYRDQLIEAAAEADETLMGKFLDGQAISDAELAAALRTGVMRGELYPVLGGDALTGVGVDRLLDFATHYLPSPLERPDLAGTSVPAGAAATRAVESGGPTVAFVFKTVSEPHIGDLLYVRVLAGTLEPGTTLLNPTSDVSERINQIYIVKGRERTEVKKLVTGAIGALVKLKQTRTSDTLCSPQQPFALKPIAFPKPSISVAIVPRSKGDEERVSNGLARLRDEDPTFSYTYDAELKQQLIYGLGELHLDIIVSRLKRKFGVTVDLVKPRVPYRETIVRKAESQGKFKKQTGGHGQYGDVWLRLEPQERGKGSEFVDEIYGGAIPSKYVPSVEKGVVEACTNGVLAGYQMIDVRTTVYDGSFHPVDSSDIAFKIAAQIAFKAAAEKAGMILLEPIYEVTVTVPEAYMGDVIGDLNSRRGRILGMNAEGRMQKIQALVPLAEMYKYSTTLRSMTQGRGYFTMQFQTYEPVPRELTAKIVEEYKRAKEQAQ